MDMHTDFDYMHFDQRFDDRQQAPVPTGAVPYLMLSADDQSVLFKGDQVPFVQRQSPKIVDFLNAQSNNGVAPVIPVLYTAQIQHPALGRTVWRRISRAWYGFRLSICRSHPHMRIQYIA